MTLKNGKVVALLTFKNERFNIPGFMDNLSSIADLIIGIDYESTDLSADVFVSWGGVLLDFEISRDWADGGEYLARENLLKEGIRMGGEFFIVLDADERFSSNFRKEWIYDLEPGSALGLWWVNLVDTKRYISEGTYFGPKYKDFVFRKKEGVGYPFAKLHVSRTPFGFEDETWERVPPDSAVVLHYQFCDPSKLIKKQAWYMVNERVFSGKSVNELNSKYSAVLTIQEEVSLVPIIWQKIPRLPSPSSDDWHLNEVLKIVSSHGFEFFDGLIFWDSVEFLEIKRILTGKRSFVFLKIANRLLRYWAKKSHQLKSQGDFMQKDFAEDIYTIQRWPLITSWDPNSKYGLSIQSRMMEVWVEFECDLLQELISSEIEGAVCEFGVFQGQTFKPLVDLVTREDPQRLLVGFDSFEGLPEPDVINDLIGWHSGQFACDKETVRTYLGNDLPNLRLVKGWFSESLADVASYGPGLEKVSFARIDSDLYASAMDVLNFLDTRLVPGSILIFDEWSFDLNKSETKAFVDWQSTTKSALTPVLIATSGFRVAFQMNDPGKTSERFTMVDTLRRQLANWKSFYLQDKD